MTKLEQILCQADKLCNEVSTNIVEGIKAKKYPPHKVKQGRELLKQFLMARNK